MFSGTNSPKPKDIYNYEQLREVGTRDTVIFTPKQYFQWLINVRIVAHYLSANGLNVSVVFFLNYNLFGWHI